MREKKPYIQRPAAKKSTGKKTIIFAALLILLLIIYSILSFYDGGSEDSTSLKTEPVFKKQGELVFKKVDGEEIRKIDIEVADDDIKRAQGLMYRTTMTESQGMLFIFDEEEEQGFWMSNTRLSLDIMYANSEGEIVKIYRSATPYSEETLPSEFPAMYVVETLAGFCQKYGITEGNIIEYQID
jgi:uncharacterized membrane protein (UPF0127 family)